MQFSRGKLNHGFYLGIDYEPTETGIGKHHWFTLWLGFWWIAIGWGKVVQ